MSPIPASPKPPSAPAPARTNGTGESSTSGAGQPPKSQKQMTKAERRELQEKQRAEKAAKAATGPQGLQNANKKGGRAVEGQTQSQIKGASGIAGVGKGAKDVKAGAGEDAIGQSRGLRIFSHFALQKTASHVVKGDVHPAIVIQDYVTPPNNTLSRHLMTHLSAQISHLVSARPMSVTMGNAIRQLKLEISGSDIDLPEQDAKDALCVKIDNYIRDRIIIADQANDFCPSLPLPVYLVPTSFSLHSGPSSPKYQQSFFGAHSLHSNGAVYSRAGTALVAMMAKQHSVPVVVCCETYKFSEVVHLDSFTKNELAPNGDLFSSFPLARPRELLVLRNQPNLEILNPLYDLTPPSSITAVVTEVGVIPPDSISSIPLALGRLMI
ncbi:hypothetical protein EW146_g7246 [Bondarzewia mesenterica]|uniref:Translation initiation factor eIF2B subunit delta n=1 Tax=Bondarzewia mesenterica TaxID=1095465 RepID=A0A4S4LLV9_9AGAM|nr:hypothetical protein EW146_g7246 [Bondarzewia mesenterica]